MKILITGATGYIGSHTTAYALENNIDIIGIDDLRNSKAYVVEFLYSLAKKKGLNLYNASTQDIDKINCGAADGIIHFAAYKSVGESVRDPLKYYDNNINSLLDTLKYALQKNIKNFVFSSSCTVYGDVSANPIKETNPIGNAASPYGYSKIVCEQILRDFHRANPSFNIAILRYFNPIGSHPSRMIADDPLSPPESLMPLLCRYVRCYPEYNFYLHGDNYNTPDGSCIRDFIDINDLARSHVVCLEWLKNQNGILEIFNVGTGNGVSVRNLLQTFKTVNNLDKDILTTNDPKFIVGQRRSGDVEQVWANTDKIERLLGYKTEFDISYSCQNAYEASLKI